MKNWECQNESIKEMQIAINMITKNDTCHIKKLSESGCLKFFSAFFAKNPQTCRFHI
jgi:hypothetical protein